MDMIQQHLFRRLSRNQKRINLAMIIKGKIASTVELKDIGRKVYYNQEISLTEFEVHKSKDLQNAIKRSWVEIIYDQAMLRRLQGIETAQKTPVQQSEFEIMDMAKKMAQTMATEMIQNSPLVKEMAKQIANEMVAGIKDNLNITVQGNAPVETKQQKIDKEQSNIFVDFKDEEIGLKANVSNIGKVEVQKDDLTSTLEKMKRFKQKAT